MGSNKPLDKHKRTWEKRYKSFEQGDSVPWQGARQRELKPLLEKYAITSGSVLDVGCGYGDKSHFLSSLGFDVVGVDISERAIKKARGKLTDGHTKFFVCDMRELHKNEEITKNSFTLILDILTSHFLGEQDKGKFINLCYKILRPAGYYFLDTYSSGVNIATSPAQIKKLYEPHFTILERKRRPSKHDAGDFLDFYVMKRNDAKPAREVLTSPSPGTCYRGCRVFPSPVRR